MPAAATRPTRSHTTHPCALNPLRHRLRTRRTRDHLRQRVSASRQGHSSAPAPIPLRRTTHENDPGDIPRLAQASGVPGMSPLPPRRRSSTGPMHPHCGSARSPGRHPAAPDRARKSRPGRSRRAAGAALPPYRGPALFDVRAQPIADATDPAPPTTRQPCSPRSTTCTPRRSSHPRSLPRFGDRQRMLDEQRRSRSHQRGAATPDRRPWLWGRPS